MSQLVVTGPTIAVVGGGISGLAAAHQVLAERPDATVVVFEASSRIGGKLKSATVGGVEVDVGAEAMLARRPEGIELASAVGLADKLIYPLSTSALLRNRARNVVLPPRTLLGIPSDVATLRECGVLSEASLEQIEHEPFAGPYPALVGDVTVGALVGERFGREVIQRLIDPLLGGVYAGRADDISLQMALPALAARLTETGGSLLRATQALLPATAPRTPIFASVAGGIWQLPAAMAADPRISLRIATTVREVLREPEGYCLVIGSAAQRQLFRADAVVLACPARKSAILLAGLSPSAGQELSTIQAAGMAIITLAFQDLAAGSLPPASGVLIPEIESIAVKAMTFSSQKWPGIGTSTGTFLLRGSVGRARDERDLQRSDTELVALLRDALARVIGLRAEPVDSHVQRWGGGIPQYPSGHAERVRRIRAALTHLPTLAVCGASYDGVGIPACIASAQVAATRVAAGLRPRGH